MRVQLLHVPDCPLTDRLRVRLHACLQQAAVSVVVEEHEGPYPSPTLLINGVDVTTGHTLTGHAYCRLDLPTHDQIVTALQTEARP